MYTTKLFPHLSETIQCSRAGNHNIVEVIWIRTSQYIYWTRWRHLHVEQAICQFANEAYQAATWRNALWSCQDISFWNKRALVWWKWCSCYWMVDVVFRGDMVDIVSLFDWCNIVISCPTRLSSRFQHPENRGISHSASNIDHFLLPWW